MGKLELLEKLILDGDKLASTISYVSPPSGVMRFYDVYRTNSPDEYQDWQSSVERFIKNYFPSESEEVKEVSKKLTPANHRKTLGILKAVRLFPDEPDKVGSSQKATNITINNSQNNTQNNTQEIIFNIFIGAIQDDLTGKEMRELKEILSEFDKEPEKTKLRLLDKLKNFGGDVLSNILANIITNPNIYTGLI